MCGSSSQQTQTYNEQQQFYQQMTSEATQAWGQDQEVLAAIKSVSAPIFAAVPSQEGLSPAEKAGLETQVKEGTAQNYSQAATAVNEKLAAEGGGNLAMPNGATATIQGQVATSAAQEESGQQLQIENADYEQGYQNWLNAGNNMFGISNALNPASFSGVANQSGSAASTTANDIATQSNSWINAAIGAAGAIGSAAIKRSGP